MGPSAPINPFAPGQVDESGGFRTSANPRKMTYNLVVSDGKRDYLADRLGISQEMRASALVPPEARTCQIVVPTKSRMGEYVPGYEPGVAATIAGRETAQAMMKLLTSDFDGLVINSKKISELFEERVLKETGRQPGNWVNIDQVVRFLKEIPHNDKSGVLLKDFTRLVSVRFTRIGRDMSFQAVRRMYTRVDSTLPTPHSSLLTPHSTFHTS